MSIAVFRCRACLRGHVTCEWPWPCESWEWPDNMLWCIVVFRCRACSRGHVTCEWRWPCETWEWPDNMSWCIVFFRCRACLRGHVTCEWRWPCGMSYCSTPTPSSSSSSPWFSSSTLSQSHIVSGFECHKCFYVCVSKIQRLKDFTSLSPFWDMEVSVHIIQVHSHKKDSLCVYVNSKSVRNLTSVYVCMWLWWQNLRNGEGSHPRMMMIICVKFRSVKILMRFWVSMCVYILVWTKSVALIMRYWVSMCFFVCVCVCVYVKSKWVTHLMMSVCLSMCVSVNSKLITHLIRFWVSMCVWMCQLQVSHTAKEDLCVYVFLCASLSNSSQSYI